MPLNTALVPKGAGKRADNLVRDVSLPALVIHRAALEHNIRWMQDFVTQSGAVLAPTAKPAWPRPCFAASWSRAPGA